MKCPICGKELEQETYYDDTIEDTSYYDFCSECGWSNYPDFENESEERNEKRFKQSNLYF